MSGFLSGQNAVFVLFALAFFTSLGVTGFTAIARLTDIPNARSAHRDPVPLAGGLGVIAAMGLSVIALPYLFPTLPEVSALPMFLGLVFAVGILGLLDDMFVVKTSRKLLMLLILSFACAHVIGPVDYLPANDNAVPLPYIAALIGTALWVFTVTNIVNFMDGSNGMMGLNMSLASFALFGVGLIAGAPISALLALILCGALLGFLPYNFRTRAQIFSGDIGALTSGFTYAGIVVLMSGESQSLSMVYAGPLLILPFLADTLLTMARRAIKGRRIWEAHNEHIYQRLIRAGHAHLSVAGFYGCLGLIMANVTIYSAGRNWLVSPWVLIVPTIILVFIYIAMSRSLAD